MNMLVHTYLYYFAELSDLSSLHGCIRQQVNNLENVAKENILTKRQKVVYICMD